MITLAHNSSFRTHSPFVLIAALACLFVVVPASAQIVSGFGGASGPGLWTMSFNNLGTPAPGNDDVAGASPNWIAVNQKAYNAVDYIDFLFYVDAAGMPTTEYYLSEGVHNGTGIEWTDYHIELGFGVGAAFVPSGPGDGLDFDAPDQNSPYIFAPFTTLTIGEDTIDAVGGIVPDGTFNVFSFPIDVPSGITEFTVRQYPTIDTVANEDTSWSDLKSQY